MRRGSSSEPYTSGPSAGPITTPGRTVVSESVSPKLAASAQASCSARVLERAYAVTPLPDRLVQVVASDGASPASRSAATVGEVTTTRPRPARRDASSTRPHALAGGLLQVLGPVLAYGHGRGDVDDALRTVDRRIPAGAGQQVGGVETQPVRRRVGLERGAHRVGPGEIADRGADRPPRVEQLDDNKTREITGAARHQHRALVRACVHECLTPAGPLLVNVGILR